MKFVICFFSKKKCKVKLKGNSLELLVMLVSISNAVAEIIAKEKEMKLDEAISFVCDCIKDGHKTLS